MWTNEKVLDLIGLYREKALLWNPKDDEYHIKPRKEDAWREISTALSVSAEDCKNKMTSLLSSYRTQKAKVKASTGTGSGNEVFKSKWFAYEAFRFLEDRDNPRKRLNIEVDNSEESTVEDPGFPEEFVAPTLRPPRPKESRTSDSDTLLSEVLGVLKDVASSSKNPAQEDMESFHFGNLVCSKLKNYDRRTKTSVQRQIMEIMFKADEGMHAAYANTGTQYSTNHTF
ncbi:hypothetical protein M8J75_012853 [Diaphorina citri]|nr:hypothetical protein M8J75_012853 [Diaphorina citri]